MKLIGQYIDRIVNSLTQLIQKLDTAKQEKIREQVYDLVLKELEKFISDNLDPSLKEKFDSQLLQSYDKDDPDKYTRTLFDHLQLIPDMLYLLDHRMKGLEAVIISEIIPSHGTSRSNNSQTT